MKDDRIYIDHVLECIEWITRFTAEVTITEPAESFVFRLKAGKGKPDAETSSA